MKQNELKHYGVKGQKWGVRRMEKKRLNAIKRIDTMYDRTNKFTARKIDRLHAKGKSAKEAVAKEMLTRNEHTRNEQVRKLKDMSTEQFKKVRKTEIFDGLFGGQALMGQHQSLLATPLNRLNEYNIQRGMRIVSNFTLNSTLARMTPAEGYEYLRRKTIAAVAYSNGSNS